MLQRAASNAYSWWWASHIRTKQSKWLEQSLQDMEEKVSNALNLIQKDGDSFAKRAEMYFKHRPELIAFIEESVRAYRALAERYDKLSTDLQKANTTIASVFPDQLPYDADYDDDDNTAVRLPKTIGPDPPKAPKLPEARDFTNKIKPKKVTEGDHMNHLGLRSGLTKEKAAEEIDKLQKDILSMQTMKEFTKSSYENGLARFWEIENEIMEMQQRVFTLQDEFKVAKGIEDDDARTIMAETALKSCEETLTKLQEKQEKSSQDARIEQVRIQNVKEKLMSLKREYLVNKADKEYKLENEPWKSNECEQEDPQGLVMRESPEELLKKPLTVTEMADTVDELVNKVISLEMMVSSQTVLINRLKIESEGLQTQIRNLEDDKANVISETFKDMEKKLNGVQDLNQDIENQNNSIRMQFTEARCDLEHLSENIHNMKPDEEAKLTEAPPSLNSKDIENSTSKEEAAEKEIPCMNGDVAKKSESNLNTSIDGEENIRISVDDDELAKQKIARPEGEHETVTDNVLKSESQVREEGVQEVLLSGLDDKEKVLLHEYTTILRKYKAAKRELADEEQKNQGTVLEMKLQLRDLENLLTRRDAEILQMKQVVQEDGGMSVPLGVAVNEEEDIMSIFIGKSEPVSYIEAKLRTDIDAILDENLDFWLRFSTAFHQVQKFKTEVEDLQQEIVKVKNAKESQVKSSTSTSSNDLKSDISPLYKHLKEIHNELTMWLDQSASLKKELQKRCSSLSDIQEEITRALREGVEEEEIKFSTHQAAKFQGEVLNMQQENSKVNEELEAGLDHVNALKLETENSLRRVEEEFEIQEQKKHRSHVPLRSFIFGTKSKKQKPSILACINPHKKLFAASGNVK